MKNRLATALLLAGCMALPAFAQERPDRDPLRSISRRLKTELGLDSDQSKTYDRLLKEHREAGSARENGAALNRLLTEAHQVGRKGKDLDKYRDQLRDLTMPITLTFLDKIEPMLNDNQRGQLEQIRKRYDPATSMAVGGVLEHLAIARADLDLNEQQAATYDESVLGVAPELVPGVKTRELSPAQLDEVLKALQEAMESGDEDAVRGVRGKVLAEQKNRTDVLLDLVLKINTHLTDAQRPALEEAVGTLFDPRVLEAEGTAPQLIARAARRCKLTDAQQTRLKEIEGTIKPAEMRNDAAARGSTIYRTRTAVEGMLDEAQRKQYRGALANPGGKSARDKKKSGDKPAKPGKPAEAEQPATPEPTEP